MPRRSKQSIINELERTLKSEQEGLYAEKNNLIRLTTEWEKERLRLTAKMNHYAEQAQWAKQLLDIVESLAARKS